MPKIIEDIEVFKALIDRLYENVTAARNDCFKRNKVAGVSEVSRITFEEIDLVEIADELLSIQKTLHWKVFDFSYVRNWDYLKKAQFLAFAGICQFVKDKYNGAFWDDYSREIGLGPDSFVYDKIWAPAFELTGAELITSWRRREFVDSFVNETGIPRHLQESLITFFEFYWTYYRDQLFAQGEVEDLIIGINNGEVDLAAHGRRVSREIKSICREVADVSSSFARRLEKVLIVAEFIKESDEIHRESQELNYELVGFSTGIDPRTIFRNQRRLERFWQLLFKRVTPSKLNSLVIANHQNSLIEKPDGSIVSGASFKCDMYGAYRIGEMEFSCVPDASISLDLLYQLDYDKIFEVSAGLIAITEDKGVLLWETKAQKNIDGIEGLQFYWGYRDVGHVFFKSYEIEMEVVRLKGANAGGKDSIIPSPKKYFNPRLVLRWSWRRKRFYLYVRLGSVGVTARTKSDENCVIKTNGRATPLATIELDENGSGKSKIKDLIISNPFPRDFSFFSEFDDGQENLLCTLKVDQTMLFTRRGGRQILPGVIEESKKISTAGFVLLLGADLTQDDLILENVNIEAVHEERLGLFQVVSLSWAVTQRPCKVGISKERSIENWTFETCLEFDFDFRRIFWTKPDSLRIPRFATTSFRDFELQIFPCPTDAEESFLTLSISDEDGPVFSLPINKFSLHKVSEEYATISGDTLNRIIEPFTNVYTKPTRISFSLASDS
ncbi:hypothetical protein N9Z29_01315, partial [bacterium]|nr:hypothetical protein [bacterium]